MAKGFLSSLFGGEDDDLPFEGPSSVEPSQDYKLQNPLVRNHLAQVYGDKFSDSAREKLKAELDQEASGPNFMAGLAALGSGLQGGDAAATGQAFLKNQQAKRDAKLSQFDDARKGLAADAKLGMDLRDDADKQARIERERDPTSKESQIAQEVAIEMGMSPDTARKLTAEQWKAQGPFYQKKYEIQESRLNRQDALRERTLARAEARADREFQKNLAREEKNQALKTPYGLANTADDAKQLKEAHESKKNFDSKLEEMIALRKKHDGGTIWNREDVARGKQLSKDLLLEYKNMAKLGVLSQSDENIINAIIPSDPLAYSAAGLMGQDPIMSNLKKFKADSDKDFSTRIATRTRDGIENYALGKEPTQREETKTVKGKLYKKVAGGWQEVPTKVVGGKTYKQVSGGWEEV
jgi:hypothetical protein